MDKILLHTCCASCSCYVIPHLQERFSVSGFFYNPNIQPEDEYRSRLDEMRRVSEFYGIELIEGEYRPESWEKVIEPFRHLPEKSRRCRECYFLRLGAAAGIAAQLGIEYFASTLSVSPHKIYPWIAGEGKKAAEIHSVRFFDEDFKKKDGFKISVARSRELGLTRQDYCGCTLSLEEARERRKKD